MNIPLIWKKKIAEEAKDEEREALPASKFLITSKKPVPDTNNQAVYKCKTCNKEFSTFQALGGHRASHSNAKLNGVNLALKYVQNKLHECDVCGEKFALGQALGGHMTKHRCQQKEKAKESENMFSLKEDFSCVSTSRESGLVTRDFFPITPSWVNAKQVEIAPILEMNDSWLELTL